MILPMKKVITMTLIITIIMILKTERLCSMTTFPQHRQEIIEKQTVMMVFMKSKGTGIYNYNYLFELIPKHYETKKHLSQ